MVRQELSELKRDLEGWRQTLLPLRRLLLWQKPYYPAILFGVTTLVFALVWFLEPSMMTTIGVVGMVVTSLDFAVLFISPYVFSPNWTGAEEQAFENICESILKVRCDVRDFVQSLISLKAERPTIYFILVMGTLATFTWIGYIMNNLFLSYLIVLTIVIFPGLQEKGLIHRYVLKYWLIFKRLVFGRLSASKSKSYSKSRFSKLGRVRANSLPPLWVSGGKLQQTNAKSAAVL
ncbi:hypothetical protein ACOMHN_041785 [Nucella lapillus]